MGVSPTSAIMVSDVIILLLRVVVVVVARCDKVACIDLVVARVVAAVSG